MQPKFEEEVISLTLFFFFFIGGALEMAISRAIEQKAKTIDSVEQWPLKAAGKAFEVIPR